ncbi:hypothetical protein E4U53_008105 [Claviceps sorghi]|nr:hypothetical protein E4U53_008105 [Claviceps sorghi]
MKFEVPSWRVRGNQVPRHQSEEVAKDAGSLPIIFEISTGTVGTNKGLKGRAKPARSSAVRSILLAKSEFQGLSIVFFVYVGHMPEFFLTGEKMLTSKKSCVKTGDICDYSVRLNWEGRRTKRPAPDRNEFESQTVPSKQFQWHRHDFSTKNGQIVELATEDNQGLEAGSPLDHGPTQLFQSPCCASLKDSEHSLHTSCFNDRQHHAGDTLTFIDETLQLHLGSTDRVSCVGKKRMDASKGIDLSRPSHQGPQVDTTAQNMHWRSEKPFTEFAKLDIRLCQSATRSAENSTGGSFTTLFSCPSTTDEPLTTATSSFGNHTAHHSDLNSFRTTNSAESWVFDNGERRELAKQSGYLWEAFDMYGFQEPLSSVHVYPYESGRLDAFGGGEMKADLQPSAGDNAYFLSHGTYIPQAEHPTLWRVGFVPDTSVMRPEQSKVAALIR